LETSSSKATESPRLPKHGIAMKSHLFCNARLFDPRCEALVERVELLVEGERVKEVSRHDGASRRRIRCRDATRIDLGGRTLMPGLIDARVHMALIRMTIEPR
jgi:imidazolonepropionase-like amidohydrolase